MYRDYQKNKTEPERKVSSSSFDANIERFLTRVRNGDSLQSLRGIVEHLPRPDFARWTDSDGLDVLHHVILAKNMEALEHILHNGFFAQPHQPDSTAYSHLAALLGDRTSLQLLLQYRPDDYKPMKIPIKLPQKFLDQILASVKATQAQNQKQSEKGSKSIKANEKTNETKDNPKLEEYQKETPEEIVEKIQKPDVCISALEIAACVKNLKCVKTILNQSVLKHYTSDRIDKNDFVLACLADNPHSLALLLTQTKITQKEWETSVEVCLTHSLPVCLDLLLSTGRSTKDMFKGINLFHVLFTYSAVLGEKSYEKLARSTEVLCKNGHNPNAKLPCRTFPVYSLLTHAYCYHTYDNTQYYIKALRVLLLNGADPNFDEIKFEKKYPKYVSQKVIGREAFSSALHCLIDTIETYTDNHDSPALAVSFVESCCSVLMQSKADMNHVGIVRYSNREIQGAILHQLAKSFVSLGVNDAIVRCVLRYGADPNLQVNGKYAINTYLDQLFDQMRTLDILDPNQRYTKDFHVFCRLCQFMTSHCIHDCLRIFQKEHAREKSSQMQPYIAQAKQELESWAHEIRTLRSLSAWTVWTACGRQYSKVHDLNVSSELKTFILPMAF